MEKQQKNMIIIDEDINVPKSERQNSMCLGGFEIPKASRIVNFNEEDFIVNSQVISCSNEESYRNLAETALVLADCHNMYHIYEYYPICHYRCNEECMLQPIKYLNSFVESISLIVVGNGGGKCYSLASGKMEEELMGYDYICYYTDIYNVNHYIINADITDFLLKKPELVVSNEGVLVFYNDKLILATLDCDHYAWVSVENIHDYKVSEITSDCSKTVIKVLSNDTNESTEHCIKFDIDALNHGLLSYHFE